MHYARAALESAAKDGRFVCYGPAGGGYGNPLERDQADDVLDEVISALRGYGVVVSTKSVVNPAATEKAALAHRLDHHTFGCGPLKAETRVRIP